VLSEKDVYLLQSGFIEHISTCLNFPTSQWKHISCSFKVQLEINSISSNALHSTVSISINLLTLKIYISLQNTKSWKATSDMRWGMSTCGTLYLPKIIEPTDAGTQCTFHSVDSCSCGYLQSTISHITDNYVYLMVVSLYTSLADNLQHTLASFLHSGASCWHGPHHEAKKSTIHSSSGDLLPTLE